MVKNFTFVDQDGKSTTWLEDRGWRIDVTSDVTTEYALFKAVERIEELEKKYLPESEWTTGKKYEEPSDE